MGNRAKTFIATATVIGASFLVVGSAFAKSDERPGWGNGDTKHVHTGPPGISVRPPGHNRKDIQKFRKELRQFMSLLRLYFFQSFFHNS